MIYGILLITFAYIILIGLLIFGFDKVAPYYLHALNPRTSFSVVIPFRNESENLLRLLNSIDTLVYPKSMFDVILVDDESTDNSIEIIKKFQNKTGFKIRLINNKRHSNSPKKDAITLAIKQSNFDWIVTTDADCMLPKYWLDSFDAFIQHNECELIVAPVTFQPNTSFLSKFQALDMLSLQGATIGGFGINNPFLSNGANLAYQKSLFYDLDGYTGNTNIASGDDVFLLEKALKRNSKQVKYLKCDKAIVTSFPEGTLKSLIAQRVRWAAKTRNYQSIMGKLTGLVVILMNILIITSILLLIFNKITINTLLYVLIIKFSIDFLLLFKSALFFDQKGILRSYFVSFLVYPFFSTYIAIASIFGSYKWKGRTFKQ